MTKLKDFYPTKWLAVEDLNGRSFELIISKVNIEAVHDSLTNKDLMKIVLTFRGAKRRMILNKTQAFRIGEITGADEIEDWIGHTILVRGGLAKNHKPTLIVDLPSQKPAAASTTIEAASPITTEEPTDATE